MGVESTSFVITVLLRAFCKTEYGAWLKNQGRVRGDDLDGELQVGRKFKFKPRVFVVGLDLVRDPVSYKVI